MNLPRKKGSQNSTYKREEPIFQVLCRKTRGNLSFSKILWLNNLDKSARTIYLTARRLRSWSPGLTERLCCLEVFYKVHFLHFRHIALPVILACLIGEGSLDKSPRSYSSLFGSQSNPVELAWDRGRGRLDKIKKP